MYIDMINKYSEKQLKNIESPDSPNILSNFASIVFSFSLSQ
jgi:hypothetical protein